MTLHCLIIALAGLGQIPVSDSVPQATLQRVLKEMYSGEVSWPRPKEKEPQHSPKAAPAPSDAKAVLVETAQSEDPITRLHGLEGLVDAGAALDHLDEFLAALGDSDKTVREFAARTVAQMPAAVVFDRVMSILCENSPQAVVVAGQLPALKTGLEPALIAVLFSVDEPPVRKEAAAYALGCMNSTAGISALAQTAWTSDPEVATWSANALAAIRDPLSIPRLAELTSHPVAGVREIALEGLAKIGGPDAIMALGRVAAGGLGGDETVCTQAARLLGGMKDDRVVPILVSAMEHNPDVTRIALESLQRITGQDLGANPADWRAWYEGKQQPAAPPLVPGTP